MATIFDQYLKPVKSVGEYQQEFAAQEDVQLKRALAKQAMADELATRQAYQSGGDGASIIQRLMSGGQYKSAQALEKMLGERKKEESEAKHRGAQTADLEGKARERTAQQVSSAMMGLYQNPTLENGKRTLDYMRRMGVYDKDPSQYDKDWAEMQASPDSIRANAEQFVRGGIASKEQMPKAQTTNVGTQQLYQSVDPLSGRVAQTGADVIQEGEAHRLTREQAGRQHAEKLAEQKRHNNMVEARAREAAEASRGSLVAEAGGPTQTAFVKQFGKAQPGYRWRADGSLEAIPGGPADIKAGEKGQKDLARAQGAVDTANRVMGTIDDALNKTGIFTAGVGGLTSIIPATPARNLQGALDTIKSNIGFDKLQAMREASPTGGALGSVAVKELDMLQASIASLDQYQSPAQLRSNLEKVNKHYTAWKDTVKKANAGVVDSQTSATGVPGGWSVKVK